MSISEQVKLKILAYLTEVKEANASKLMKIAECANKTFFKARKELEKEGLIKKRYEPKNNGGIYAIYYIPEEKQREVKTILDRENIMREVKNMGPDEIEVLKRKLKEAETELKYYKILEQIRELEEMPLPEKAVRKILENKIGEIAQKIPLNDVSNNSELDELGPVIIKEVSWEEYTRRYMFHHGWKRLYLEIKHGKIEKAFIGIYRKLVKLYGELEKLREKLESKV